MTENGYKEPETFEELKSIIKEYGEKWRVDNEIETSQGVKTPRPSVQTVAKTLLNMCHFAFIGYANKTDELQLYVYDIEQGFYIASDDFIVKLVLAFDGRLTSKTYIMEVITYIRAYTPTRRPFEDDKRIPVYNGVFNLETKELEPFSPKFAITSKIQTAYNENAKDKPNIKDFDIDEWMNSIACGDDDIVMLLWQVLNESINPNRTRKKMVWLLGDGNNGKGTYQRLIENLNGFSNISSLKPEQFAENFMLASLDGKTCNIGDDANSEYLNNVSNLMSITTGDTVQVNPKHKKPYEANYKLLCLFSANQIPRARSKAHGLYRRLCIVPFNADFNGKAERPEIKEKFFKDKRLLEHVLYRVLNMPDFDEFIEPEAVKKMVEEYQEDNDYIYSFVVDEYMKKGWHELTHVPMFFIKDRLLFFTEEKGIRNPKIYGYGGRVTKILKQKTGEEYTQADGRVPTQERHFFNEHNTDYMNQKLQKNHNGIQKKKR